MRRGVPVATDACRSAEHRHRPERITMESRAVSAKRASIAQVMSVVALAAVNLAILRALPRDVVVIPTIWVLMGSVDFVFLRKLILRRTLRAFHYTSLIAFVVAWVATANFVAMERFQPLGFLVR